MQRLRISLWKHYCSWLRAGKMWNCSNNASFYIFKWENKLIYSNCFLLTIFWSYWIPLFTLQIYLFYRWEMTLKEKVPLGSLKITIHQLSSWQVKQGVQDISPAIRFALGYMKMPKEHQYKDKTDVNSLNYFPPPYCAKQSPPGNSATGIFCLYW